MAAQSIANDGEEFPIQTDGQHWLISWHPPITVPAGKPHGAAGICVTDSSEVVLISTNGSDWDVPAGRTEVGETWEQTLRREMLEEACATVTTAKLLGFSRGRCISGHEAGLVIIRSFWRADVQLGVWEPQFEISHRRTVPANEALSYLSPVFLPVFRRAFQESELL